MMVGRLEVEMVANLARLTSGVNEGTKVIGAFARDVNNHVASINRILGTIGVGLSLGALLLLTKHTIDSIAKMKDLGQEAGTTAAAISKFEAPARMAGLSLDAVAAAMFKMSKAALEAKDPASKAAQALDSIGISTAQLKGLKPDEMFELVARQLGKYGDGLAKNAVMQELFGKSGREMSRVVAEIAEGGKLAATVTDEEAAAADRLQDQFVKLKMNSEKLWRSLVSEGVPAMNDILTAFIDGQREGGIYQGVIDGLSAAFSKMRGDTLADQLRRVNEEIDKQRAADKGQLGVLEILAMEHGNINKLLQDRANIEHAISVQEVKDQDARALRGLKPGKGDPKFDPAAAALAAAAAKKAEAEATRLLLAQAKFLNDEVQKAIDLDEQARLAKEGAARSFRENVEQLEFEVTLLGKSNAERQVAIALRELEKAGLDRNTESVRRYVERIRAGVKAQEDFAEEQRAIAAQASMWSQMGDAVGAFFGDLVANGRDAFKNLRDELKRFAQEIIALTAKRWFLQLVAGIGVAGAGNAAASMGANTASGVASNYLGTGASMAGNYLLTGSTAAGSAWAAGTAGYTANAAYLTGAAEMAPVYGTFAGEMGGALAGVETALAAVPVWGWIALAVIAIGAWIAGNHKGGPKFGGSFVGEFDGTGAMVGPTGQRLFTPNQADSQMQMLVEGTAAGFYKALGALSGKTAGFNFGIGFDVDNQGRADDRVSATVTDAAGRSIYSHIDQSTGDMKLEQVLALEGQRMILAALQASELPKEVAEILDTLVAESASAEEINAVLNAAVEMNNVLNALPHLYFDLSVEDLKAFALDGESIGQTFNRVATSMAQFDEAFMTDAQKIERAQEIVNDAFAQLGVTVPESTAAYYDLVHGLDLSTEAGREMFATLLQIAPAFLVAASAVDTAAEVVESVAQNLVAGFDHNGYWQAMVDAAAAARDLAEQLSEAKLRLGDYLQGLLLNQQLSPLDPMERLAEAQKQYEETLALARGGDLGAVNALSGRSDAYLSIAREIFASSSAYVDIFKRVFDQVAGVAGNDDYNTRMIGIQTNIYQTLMQIRDQAREDSAYVADTVAAAVDRNTRAVESSSARRVTA